MDNNNLYGSICLSDIPEEVIETAKNGKKYLNIKVCLMKQPDSYGKTHFISCEPIKKEERKSDVNYYIGKMKEFGTPANSAQTSPAPSVGEPAKAVKPAPETETFIVNGEQGNLPF